MLGNLCSPEAARVTLTGNLVSTPHPTQSLCTLQTPHYRDACNSLPGGSLRLTRTGFHAVVLGCWLRLTLHLETVLTDATLLMFDKLMGGLSRRAERGSEEQVARSAGELRVRLSPLAGSCRALIAARDVGIDLEEAIEQHMGWAR
jgi:hypothetical protein